MLAYIRTFHSPYADPRDQHQVSAHEAKEAPTAWQALGLQESATGYGKRLTTRHMVQYRGKWRRVYCCVYSNVGTCYIGKLSDNLIITHLDH